MNEFPISIADMPVRLALDAPDAGLSEYLADRYAEFRDAAPGARAFRVLLRPEPGPPFIPIAGSGLFEVRTGERNGLIEFESYYEKGWMDLGARRGELTLRQQGEVENYLRVLYAWLCLEQDAVLLHASGIVRNGRGYAFAGHSGSGKTTITRLSLDYTVLSDDLVILKLENKGVRLYGVPFRGEFQDAPRTNASAPLTQVLALTQDTEHRVEPLGPGEAVGRLAECAPFVMAHPVAALRVLALCAEIQKWVPVCALHFRRDAAFWSVLDESG